MTRNAKCLLLIGLICLLGISQAMATEFTRADLNNIRVKMDIHPMYANGDETVRVMGDILITSDAYTLEKEQVTVEENFVYVDFTFSRGDFAPAKEILFLQPFDLAVGQLAEGKYIFLTRVNGIDLFEREYLVSTEFPEAPNPTPKPMEEPIPFYKPWIQVNPEQPQPEEDVQLIVKGYLPDTAHTITSAKAEINEQEIVLNMNVESSGIGAEVLVPIEQEFPIGKLEPGGYYVVLLVNGQPAAKQKFIVGDGTIVKPKPNPYDAQLIIDPVNPAVNEEFQIVLKGFWPMSGYEITQTDVETTRSDVAIRVQVKEPEVGNTVMTPFKETVAKLSLNYGVYTVNVSINGERLKPVTFWVGQNIRDGRETKADSFLSYRVESPNQEEPTYLNIDGEGNAVGLNREVDPENTLGVMNGKIGETEWETLVNALSEADFANLPPQLGSEGGAMHVITYNTKMVRVYEGAEISEPLKTVVDMLNKFSQDLYIDQPSAVAGWELY
ncbi:hypothetical protein GF373_10895 [bacterium]|nr:hypothetical protein [bacterium]